MVWRVTAKKILLNKLWKETARKIKLARMKSRSLEEYNIMVGKYFDLHTYYEYQVDKKNMLIKKVDYMKILNAIEREKDYITINKFLKSYNWEKWYYYKPKDMRK